MLGVQGRGGAARGVRAREAGVACRAGGVAADAVTAPDKKAAAITRAEDELRAAAQGVANTVALDAILDRDAECRRDPLLRALVRARIQRLVPRLRDN
jgi:hypothetical protein